MPSGPSYVSCLWMTAVFSAPWILFRLAFLFFFSAVKINTFFFYYFFLQVQILMQCIIYCQQLHPVRDDLQGPQMGCPLHKVAKHLFRKDEDNLVLPKDIFHTTANTARCWETRLTGILWYFDEMQKTSQKRLDSCVTKQEKWFSLKFKAKGWS